MLVSYGIKTYPFLHMIVNLYQNLGIYIFVKSIIFQFENYGYIQENILHIPRPSVLLLFHYEMVKHVPINFLVIDKIVVFLPYCSRIRLELFCHV